MTAEPGSTIPLDASGPRVLPAASADAGANTTMSLLERVSPMGKRMDVVLLGQNLPVTDLAHSPDGALVVTGIYGKPAFGQWGEVRIGGPGGTSVSLPPCTSDDFQRTFFMKVSP
jgi:hypothetical protein